MATMDIFRDSAFHTRELSEAINVVPNQFGLIGELGLFQDKSIRTPAFQIESQNGVLSLITSSQRGAPMPGLRNGKREMRDFSTRRFAQESRITADEIEGIRAFGSESELKQAVDEVNGRIITLRANTDITREYLRAGALRGVVLDADGSTIVDLYSAFGVTQKAVDFTFGTTGTDWAAKSREISRHIEINLKGDMMTGVTALCSPGFWDRLMEQEDFQKAYTYYATTVSPLREDTRKEGIRWMGITWMEYLGSADTPNEDGTWTTRKFIPDNEARFFPTGTRSTFRQFNAPADYLETVNTPGQPFYAKIAPDEKWGQFVDVQAQMNTLPICMRPAVLVRGHSSN
ncbi:major capsid protein [Amaricoccus solimangrovi]|uniref:Major capsid protein n=1 Tax=Amaricoccus solimangrovi TaxID=2589815 RepID=A0A501WEI3_9RHOB|nr:major capsid protein [Amaricoccus solimangrovi]TPE47232.1 major capsid protein [Amaricoccus solimangrovi]